MGRLKIIKMDMIIQNYEKFTVFMHIQKSSGRILKNIENIMNFMKCKLITNSLPADLPNLALFIKVVAMTGPYLALALKNAVAAMIPFFVLYETAMPTGGGI